MKRRGVELAALTAAVNSDRARTGVRRYFSAGRDGKPRFSGAHFDTLDRAEGDTNVITPADIVAVQMLSVVVPAPVALDLLEGSLRVDLAEQLERVPTDVVLGTAAAAEHIKPDGPAEKAWRLLKACDGVGWVIAGKLLARKRPSLIPVYDTVIRCVVARPKNFWLYLNERLRENDGELIDCLARLRAEVDEIPATVSDIRLLDIVLWMGHREDHRSYGCSRLQSGGSR